MTRKIKSISFGLVFLFLVTICLTSCSNKDVITKYNAKDFLSYTLSGENKEMSVEFKVSEEKLAQELEKNKELYGDSKAQEINEVLSNIEFIFDETIQGKIVNEQTVPITVSTPEIKDLPIEIDDSPFSVSLLKVEIGKESSSVDVLHPMDEIYPDETIKVDDEEKTKEINPLEMIEIYTQGNNNNGFLRFNYINNTKSILVVDEKKSLLNNGHYKNGDVVTLHFDLVDTDFQLTMNDVPYEIKGLPEALESFDGVDFNNLTEMMFVSPSLQLESEGYVYLKGGSPMVDGKTLTIESFEPYEFGLIDTSASPYRYVAVYKIKTSTYGIVGNTDEIIKSAIVFTDKLSVQDGFAILEEPEDNLKFLIVDGELSYETALQLAVTTFSIKSETTQQVKS